MGKTKTKLIDDSQPVVEEKKKKINPNKEEAKLQPVIASEAKQSKSEENPTQIASSSGFAGLPRNDGNKKAQKPGKAKPRSKKYQKISEGLERGKSLPLTEAVELTKKLSYSKFTGTMEIHINTAQTGIRGLVTLPFSSGKKLKIVAFGPSASPSIPRASGPRGSGQVKELSGAGATVGDETTIEEINKGKVDFDLLVTTPDWMPKLAKVARILGPRGLMPNPKNGTITDDLKKAVEGFQMGKTEYKTESKAAVIHLGLGKLDQPSEQLSANVKTLLQTIGKTRVRKITLSPTMGPSVKVDLTSV